MRYSYDNLEMTVTYRKDKEIEIQVANHNTFRVGNITVTTEYAVSYRITCNNGNQRTLINP